jgi:hypothetical protein
MNVGGQMQYVQVMQQQPQQQQYYYVQQQWRNVWTSLSKRKNKAFFL